MTDSQWRPYTRSSNTLNSQFQALNSFLLYTVDARVWEDMLQGHVTETHSSATVAGTLAEGKSKGAYIFATTCDALWCVAGAF